MVTLADAIEAYLKRLLTQTDGSLDVRRTDLAERFDCVPSQINYVLKTRFTVERGYVVESRRGGGGFIRIVQTGSVINHSVADWINQKVGKKITREASNRLLIQLREAELMTSQELMVLRHILDRETMDIEPPWSDIVRASILRALLLLNLKPE